MSFRISDLKVILTDLVKEGSKVGLSINKGKTKEMRVSNANDEEQLSNRRLQRFQYHEIIVLENGGTEEDVANRV